MSGEGSVLRAQGSELRAQSSGLRAQGSELRAQGRGLTTHFLILTGYAGLTGFSGGFFSSSLSATSIAFSS
ncbi:MAG: hypothetical protein H6Q23_1799 [Bacteroidetes bacterium]|nr:hypothetical protein [Bacteroidota bacterium]